MVHYFPLNGGRHYGPGSTRQRHNDSGNDSVITGDGADISRGGAGNDVLKSGGGRDDLLGGRGRDQLFGGLGADHLTGGQGMDVFVFRTAAEAGKGAARDTIVDFAHGIDKIDISAIDANTNRAGNQGFDFIGHDAFSSTAGEIHLKNGIVSGDRDDDGSADFSIGIANLAQLSQSDFIL